MRVTIANIVFAVSWVGMMAALALQPHLSESAQAYASAALFAFVGIGMASGALGFKWKFGTVFLPKDRGRPGRREIAMGIVVLASMTIAMVVIASLVPQLGLSKEWKQSATIGVIGIAVGIAAFASHWLRRAEAE